MLKKTTFSSLVLLSLFGLCLIFSPMFGTAESMVFPSLGAYPNALLAARIGNLGGFGAVMAALVFAGERIRGLSFSGVVVWVLGTLGCIGVALGAFVGLGVLPVGALVAGGVVRGLFYGAITVFWIDALIHLEDRNIGMAVAGALVVYALAGVLVVVVVRAFPLVGAALLVACPALGCAGLASARSANTHLPPVDQGNAQAPFTTRILLYVANLTYGVIFGALLWYFARFDTLAAIVAFLLSAAVLLAVFVCAGNRLSVSAIYRAFSIMFAVAVAILLLSGMLSPAMANAAASAVLAVIMFYTVVIFTDTQARLRHPYWKVPGACQVFAALGMIGGSVWLQAVYPQGGLGPAQLVLLAAACIIFVLGVFSPNARTRLRPWGFSSLIPNESPEERAQRRCGELAEEYGLTDRELEIVKLLAAGKSREQIASTLVISPATTKTHIRNIYAKLDVHSQAELNTRMDV